MAKPEHRPTRYFYSNALLITGMYLPAVTAVCILALNRALNGIPTHYLTWDTAALARVPVYTGIFSSIGIILWGATVIVTFFSYLLMKRYVSAYMSRFFLWSGIITMLLLMDDMLELRARVYPHYLHASMKWVEIVYVLLVVGLLIIYRKQVLLTAYRFLIAAGVFFVLSISIDLIDMEFFASTILEDGSKLLGITSWFAYFFMSGYGLIRNLLSVQATEGNIP